MSAPLAMLSLSLADPPGVCVSVDGAPIEGAAIRARLARRGLAVDGPSAGCRPLLATITPEDGRVRVTLTLLDGPEAERLLADLETAADWIESWARPELGLALPDLAPAPVVAERAASSAGSPDPVAVAWVEPAWARPAPAVDAVAEAFVEGGGVSFGGAAGVEWELLPHLRVKAGARAHHGAFERELSPTLRTALEGQLGAVAWTWLGPIAGRARVGIAAGATWSTRGECSARACARIADGFRLVAPSLAAEGAIGASVPLGDALALRLELGAAWLPLARTEGALPPYARDVRLGDDEARRLSLAPESHVRVALAVGLEVAPW